MNREQIQLLAQEIGVWEAQNRKEQTKHLIEAMPCGCCFSDVDIAPQTCNRCIKLRELEEGK